MQHPATARQAPYSQSVAQEHAQQGAARREHGTAYKQHSKELLGEAWHSMAQHTSSPRASTPQHAASMSISIGPLREPQVHVSAATRGRHRALKVRTAAPLALAQQQQHIARRKYCHACTLPGTNRSTVCQAVYGNQNTAEQSVMHMLGPMHHLNPIPVTTAQHTPPMRKPTTERTTNSSQACQAAMANIRQIEKMFTRVYTPT